MSKGLYFRLALQNLTKNRRFYFPYMLACTGTVMMFYLMMYLYRNPAIQDDHGTLRFVLGLGSVVTALFSVIFVFYTNTFLMKRRKKEIGLFNILGMEKKHIAGVMAVETVYTALICLALGIFLGIVFSKLFLMMMIRLMGNNVIFGFSVSLSGMGYTLALFGLIFFLTLIYNLTRISLSKPVELLSAENAGEREPKAKWILAVLGALTLGTGYFLAVRIKDPTTAFLMFFIAVLLVIVGTYLLFCVCSIAMLKLMQKNKKFYYKLKNFTSVSGMLYRMKQNAAGLASICILSTMMLVTVSTTVSLYMGVDELVDKNYFRDIYASVSGVAEDDVEALCARADKIVVENGFEMKNLYACRFTNYYLFDSGDKLSVETEADTDSVEVRFVPERSYNRISGENVSLGENELLIYSAKPREVSEKLTFYGKEGASREFKVKGNLDTFPEFDSFTYMESTLIIIVKDDSALQSIDDALEPDLDSKVDVRVYATFGFDIDATGEEAMALRDKLDGNMGDGTFNFRSIFFGTKAEGYNMVMALFGGLFFVGILLGLLFTAAAVLIIYYKQISEGYEDKKRFEIMQKVGMSFREVKHSIRRQVLIVFFLPLVTSFIHLAFAFNMISVSMEMLKFTDTSVYLMCTAGTAVLFALLYTAVYLVTAKVYYKIVGSGER